MGEGSGWRRGGGSHCKQCANDITTNSKNNVIFFYKQKIPISPFVQPPFDIPLLLTVLHPSPYSPFWGSLFPSLNKGEEIKR